MAQIMQSMNMNTEWDKLKIELEWYVIKIGLNVNTHSLQRICQQIKFNISHKRRHDLWKRIHQLFNNAKLSAIKAVLLIYDNFSFRFLFFLTNDFIFMGYVILFDCFLIHTVKVERVIPYALVRKEDASVWIFDTISKSRQCQKNYQFYCKYSIFHNSFSSRCSKAMLIKTYNSNCSLCQQVTLTLETLFCTLIASSLFLH